LQIFYELTNILYIEYIPLVCFDKLKQPRKKLDGAVDIPYNLDNLTTYGQIEEEILSRTHNFPEEWGKIEIGLICYQKNSSAKSDHFNLKSSDSITAFAMECKKNKNIQLCVYSASAIQIKRKEMVSGSSVIEDDMEESAPKKLRVLLLYIFISYIFYYRFNKKILF
jgi:hypothetical protein